MSRAQLRQALKQAQQMNLLERAIAKVSPGTALTRMRNRVALAYAGAYTGASRSKRAFAEWSTSDGDADADTLYDLPTLRARSRDLKRNNPLAAGALTTKVANVVGTGLVLKSVVDRKFLGLSDDQAEALQEHIEREFRLWCESPNADLSRTLNFYALQELAFTSVLENGDCGAMPVYVPRPGVAYDLAVQLIEADRICNENWGSDTEKLAGGVERDEHGAPLKYHVLRQHPGANRLSATGWKWDKVNAFTPDGRRNFLHLYRQIRIGQSRGIPDLAPVISAIKQLGDYTEAEITAAVVAGMFTVFIEGGEGGDAFGGLTTDASDSTRADQQSIKMGPGAIVDTGNLGEGGKIHTANPGRPNSAFDPFVLAILRQIGVALELPLELLTLSFQASYSASRAALLQAWKFFKARRTWLADNFCQPIFEAWMWEAVAKGRVVAPGFLHDPAIRHAYLGSDWVGDAPGALDPLKEAQACALMEDRGWVTASENTAALTGGDWEQKHGQRAKEHRMRVADDLEPKITVVPSAPAQPAEGSDLETAPGRAA